MKIRVTYVKEANPDAIRFLAGILYEFIKKDRGHILRREQGEANENIRLPALGISSAKRVREVALLSKNI